MLGGSYTPRKSTAVRNYTGLAAHNLVHLELDVWMIDTIDGNDFIRFDIDGTKLNVGKLSYESFSGANECESNNTGFKFRILLKYAHSASSLTLKVSFD